ncbi:hypothetical protein RhiirA1_454140 [Rhizophagus irregularis]|uniref:Uncharacterized protein n=1 Tax=Rhizophagus irregularis TaxID=588596 RepID=A0A2I1E1T9_9GLOM|nr:hypothetical protein RhiirA1_454140 [Rhizophagus irregularis]PKY16102.1 hypothetical protein RhiirB3_428427 [Rhizophagus irregularis]
MTFTSIVSEINLITTINIIILLYVSRYYYKYFTCQSQLPGPFPLPLIGNLHQIGLNPAQYVKDNHKKYGDMFEIWVDPGTVKHANVDGLAFNGNLTTWKRNRKINESYWDRKDYQIDFAKWISCFMTDIVLQTVARKPTYCLNTYGENQDDPVS